MVEVFKITVQQEEDATILLLKLAEYFPQYNINFDLTDCDNILRVEGNLIAVESIMNILAAHHFECVVLD